MALQIGRAFQDGIGELFSRRGALFAGAFVLYGLLSSVVWGSLSQAFAELVLGQLPSDAQVSQAAMSGGAPLALDIPLGAAAVGAIALYVVSEALNIVAIRAFASDGRDVIPPNAGRQLVRTVAVAIAATVLAGIATAIGFVLLILPGIVLLVLFFFVRQEIALNDSGVIESISNSISIVRENALATAAIFLLLGVFGLVTAVVGVLPVTLPPVLSAAITTAISGVIAAFSIAVTTVAYLQVAEPGDGTSTLNRR